MISEVRGSSKIETYLKYAELVDGSLKKKPHRQVGVNPGDTNFRDVLRVVDITQGYQK